MGIPTDGSAVCELQEASKINNNNNRTVELDQIQVGVFLPPPSAPLSVPPGKQTDWTVQSRKLDTHMCARARSRMVIPEKLLRVETRSSHDASSDLAEERS